MKPTDISNPDYFHKVVDCQWACPAHTPVPEYIRQIAAGLDITLDGIEEMYVREPAPEDFDIASGHIAKGTAAALRFEVIGMVDGQRAVVLEQRAVAAGLEDRTGGGRGGGHGQCGLRGSGCCARPPALLPACCPRPWPASAPRSRSAT